MIYLDYASTTPCSKEVLSAMLPYYRDIYYNPSNITHILGRQANESIEISRRKVADAIGAYCEEIFFTSGATEANNLALQGFCNTLIKNDKTKRRHIITSKLEHKSVLECIKYIHYDGFTVNYITPDVNGRIGISEIAEIIQEDTVLVSVMWVNNETGILNDIEAIAKFLSKKNILFHCDASQALGKVGINLRVTPIDFLSLSAHKIYGPKGMGVLYINYKSRDLITPLFRGGGQENNIRSGTLNSPAIVGMGVATENAVLDLNEQTKQIVQLRDNFERLITSEIAEARINSQWALRSCHISSVSFDIKQEVNLIDFISEIACSSGAACDSTDNKPSQVLMSLGLSPSLAKKTLRFSFGKYTTSDQIDAAVNHIKTTIENIKSSF